MPQFQRFSARAGLPLFSSGRLSVGEPLPDVTLQFVLTGEAGFRYLVEKRLLPHNWVPLLILTNVTGTVSFTDPAQKSQSAQFYRSRMPD